MSSPIGLTFDIGKNSTPINKYKVYSGSKVQSIFGSSVFSPFPKTIDPATGNVLSTFNLSDVHNNDVYDTSITSIVDYTSKKGNKAMKLTYADFAYLKNLGVYPNNRLIVARRFPSPVTNDLHAVNVAPLSTMISWVGDENSFFDVSYNEEWTDSEASFVEVLNDLGKDLIISKDLKGGMLGSAVAGGLGALPFPGLSEAIQRKVLQKFGLVSDPYNLPLGNPNLIRQSKRRETVAKDSAGSGLYCDIKIKMTVEYEQKFINGVDSSLVYLDIIQNALTFGTSDSAFQLATPFATGTSKLLQNLSSGNFSLIFKGLYDVLESLFGEIKKLADELISGLSSNKVKEAIDPTKIDQNANDAAVFLAQQIKNAFDFSAKVFSSIIGKYKIRLLGIINALTGNPSTPWHITIGNPKKPIFCSGDMLLKSVNMELGPILSFNDLPSTIKFELSFENARSLGAQEIFNRLNTGRGRSYIKASIQNGKISTKTLEETPQSGELANSSDIKYATIGGNNSSSQDWLNYNSPKNAITDTNTNNGNAINLAEAQRDPMGNLTNLSDLNTSKLAPSLGSGIGKIDPFIEVPLSNPISLPDPALTKLDNLSVKNASDSDLSTRLNSLNSSSLDIQSKINANSFGVADEYILDLHQKAQDNNTEIKLIQTEQATRLIENGII